MTALAQSLCLVELRLNRSEALRAQRAAIADLFTLGDGWELTQDTPLSK